MKAFLVKLLRTPLDIPANLALAQRLFAAWILLEWKCGDHRLGCSAVLVLLAVLLRPLLSLPPPLLFVAHRAGCGALRACHFGDG